MRPRIGLVAPYLELAELAREVSRDLGISIDIRMGDLAQGVDVARKMEQEGDEVIISRGGTALAIERAVDLPVIAIDVSGFDVLRALHQARQLGPTVGVVGFRNVIYGAAGIQHILGMDIREITLDAEEEAESKIAGAVSSGIHVFVGDSVSIRTAERHGLKGVLIRSGKEAILQAINLAERAASIRRREHERTEQLKAILDYAYEGIISVDSRGVIQVFNPSAEKILGIRAADALGKPAVSILPGLRLPLVRESGMSELEDVVSIGKALVVANSVPISVKGENVGAVVTFQDVTGIQQLEAKVRKELYLKGHVARYRLSDLVGESPALRAVVEEAERFAATDATILITGETGTGKEMLAQGIHNASPRRHGPFVALNCAALPESILESEVFGYEEGAFTGARRGGKPGLFELAHGGTVFLDEIGEMSLAIQARLLRVLERKEVMRLGGDRVIPVNVRVLAATHRNLAQAMREGLFREDLFYRLNVLNLVIPPLRERRQDIPVLARHFLLQATGHLQAQGVQVTGARATSGQPSMNGKRRAIGQSSADRQGPADGRGSAGGQGSADGHGSANGLRQAGGQQPAGGERSTDPRPKELTPEAIEVLARYDWPGNVRELRNMIERLVLTSNGPKIGRAEVMRVLSQMARVAGGAAAGSLMAGGAVSAVRAGAIQRDSSAGLAIPMEGTLDEIEHRVIHEILAACGGSKSIAARRLGISRSTLWRKLGGSSGDKRA